MSIESVYFTELTEHYRGECDSVCLYEIVQSWAVAGGLCLGIIEGGDRGVGAEFYDSASSYHVENVRLCIGNMQRAPAEFLSVAAGVVTMRVPDDWAGHEFSWAGAGQGYSFERIRPERVRTVNVGIGRYLFWMLEVGRPFRSYWLEVR